FAQQLAALRFGRMSRFAIVGGFGAVVNVGIVALLTWLGMHYVLAAIIAAETTIIMNFLLIERFVFRDLRRQGRRAFLARFAQSVGFNNAEALVRLPIMALLVEGVHLAAVAATALTLAVAFLVRF